MKYTLLFFIFFCSLSVWGQNTRVDGIAFQRSGMPSPFASVAVCSQPAIIATTPCSPRVALCTSLSDAVCAVTNPITADGLGNYFFYTKPGTYTYQFYGSGLTTKVLADQSVGAASIAGGTPPGYGTVVTANGLACDGATDDTSALSTLLTSIGSTPTKLVFPVHTGTNGQCLLSSIAIPTTVTNDFSSGGSLKARTSTTPAGGGGFDGAGSTATFNPSSTSCAVTVTPSSPGETYFIYTVFGFGAGAIVSQPTSSVTSDVIPLVPSFQSNTNVSMLSDGWMVGNAAAGARTFTFTYSVATWNSCGAYAISGIGPIPNMDGAGSSTQGTASPMSSGSATFQSGSFLIAFGGQHNNTETCTQGGSFTQPAGPLGQVGTSGTVCTQYLASSSAGALTASQSISSAPTGLAWTYNVIGIRPGSANISILGGVFDPDLHQLFFNAVPGLGTISLAGNLALSRVYPEWWGASASATGATNTPPIQAAITAALGTGLPIYNKTLDLSRGIYNINAETQWYGIRGNQTARFEVDCGSTGGLNQTTANLRIMDSQGMAYGRFDNCQWQKSATDTAPTALLDIDWNGIATPNSLKPQFLDFYGNSFVSNGSTDVGLLGAKSGGAAQFSNIYCYDCAFQGFSGAGFQIGGDGAGRNSGRLPATNALAIALYGGDMQNCPLYGLANYGGGYIDVYGTSFECISPWASYLTKLPGGFDMYSQGSQGPMRCHGVRSEDLKLMGGAEIDAEDCSTSIVSQGGHWYTPTNQSLPNTSLPINYPFSGSDVGGDGKLYQMTNNGTFGGLPINYATSGSATTLVDANNNIPGALTSGTFVAAETVTQTVTGSTATLLAVPLNGQLPVTVPGGGPDATHTWVGGTSGAIWTPSGSPAAVLTNGSFVDFPYQITLLSGAGAGEICGPITNTTTTTITCPSGWVTNYTNITLGNPDTTTKFVIEPCWGICAGSRTASGTATFALLDFYAVGGDNLNTTSGSCNLNKLAVQFGRVQCNNLSDVHNLTVTRTDWWDNANFQLSNGIIFTTYDNVKVGRQFSTPGVPNNQGQITWNIGRRNGGASSYSGATQFMLGTRPLVWATGQNGGGTAANDVWIGGRSDPSAGTNGFRTRLELGGLLGAAAPHGLNMTDQAGVATQIGGGPSTGSGIPGNVEIWIGSTAGSGATVNTGTRRWYWDGATGHLFASTDNTYDIGAAGATRPRTGYFGTSIVTPSETLGGVVETSPPASAIHGICKGLATANNANGVAVTNLGGDPTINTCLGSTAVAKWGLVVTHACTLRNFYVNAGAAGKDATDAVMTLQDNAVGLAITCTVGAGTACNDTTHTVAAAAGDMIWVKGATEAATTLADVSVSVDCQKTFPK